MCWAREVVQSSTEGRPRWSTFGRDILPDGAPNSGSVGGHAFEMTSSVLNGIVPVERPAPIRDHRGVVRDVVEDIPPLVKDGAAIVSAGGGGADVGHGRDGWSSNAVHGRSRPG